MGITIYPASATASGPLGVATATSLAINGTLVSELTSVSTLSSTPRGITSLQASSDNSSARFNGYKSRGTQASPTTVVTADLVTRWSGWPHDGANYLEMSSIVMGTEGTIAATRTPTYMQFLTATDAAPSVLTEAMKLDSAQKATFSGRVICSVVGAASAPMLTITGATFTGGSATTTKPTFLVEPTGTTSAAWSTNGTLIGANAASGFTGDLLNLQLAGARQLGLSSNGTLTINAALIIGTQTAVNFSSTDMQLGNGSNTSFLLRGGSTAPLKFNGSTASFPALGVTSQTNPILIVQDANGGATASLQVGGSGNTGSVNNIASQTITGTVADGLTAALTLAPTYTAATAQTVTRHNYIEMLQPTLSGAGPAAITNACAIWFDAAIGTHKAVDAATTKVTVTGVDAWIKVNLNGVVGFVPVYLSKTA